MRYMSQNKLKLKSNFYIKLTHLAQILKMCKCTFSPYILFLSLLDSKPINARHLGHFRYSTNQTFRSFPLLNQPQKLT